MELLWEFAGWAGAVTILTAYLTVSMGWLKTGKAFQTANLVGAGAFIVNGAFHANSRSWTRARAAQSGLAGSDRSSRS